jgi:AcrR family transcriptional regulator
MRNAEATRARLLASARKEFALFGIAGARVDRIAVDAGSNKAQIYHYFGSKDGLFDAVFSSLVAEAVEGIPLDVDDLPEYAARLCRGYDSHPDVMRLSSWHRLERGNSPLVQAALDSNRAKIADIAAAQANGVISNRFEPGVLLALVLQVAAMWAEMPDELAQVIGSRSAKARASTVAEAVRALLSEENQADGRPSRVTGSGNF